MIYEGGSRIIVHLQRALVQNFNALLNFV